MFETATPFDTPRLMAELVQWVNGERDKAALHPLLEVSPSSSSCSSKSTLSRTATGAWAAC